MLTKKFHANPFVRSLDVYITAFPFVPLRSCYYALVECNDFNFFPYFESTPPALLTALRIMSAGPSTSTHSPSNSGDPSRGDSTSNTQSLFAFGPGFGVTARSPLSAPPPATVAPHVAPRAQSNRVTSGPSTIDTVSPAPSTSQPQNPHSDPTPSEEPAPNRLFDE